MNIPPNALVVLCGPAGSGKSTWAARHFTPTQVVSSDRLRAMVCDDESDQQASASAFFLLRALVRLRLQHGRLTVVDSTALRAQNRRELLKLGRAQGVQVVAIVFDVDITTCRRRNQARARHVPDDVLDLQHRLLARSLLTIQDEGFDSVIRLDEGSSDGGTAT